MAGRPTDDELKDRLRLLEQENAALKQEAREHAARHRSILDSMQEAYLEVDLKGRVVAFNEMAVKMMGYRPEELKGMDYRRFSSPEVAERIFKVFSRVYATGEPASMVDYEALHKDGSLRDHELSTWLMRDAAGRCIGYHILVRDVTARKRSEQCLRASEERYRAIFENTATANIITAEDTTILLANTNFERLTGYSRQELEGRMSWTLFVVPEDLERMKQYHFKRRSEPDAAPHTYEFKARVRSGEIKDFFMSVAMIPGTRDSIASLIDISEWKRTEEALRQNEERFRDLAQLLPESVFETDMQGNLTFVNQVSLERFGYSLEDLERGMNFMNLVAPQDRERILANVQRIMQGERLGLNEYTVMRKDGTTFPAMAHTVIIVREGRPEGLRGFLVDITEKKQMEEQLLRAQKMEAIGTLAGGIAHDFNNLLMGILGNISLMLMQLDESHAFYERLKYVEQYVKRGSDLTKQLLGFARGGKYGSSGFRILLN